MLNICHDGPVQMTREGVKENNKCQRQHILQNYLMRQ